MAEGDGLLNRYTGNPVSRVRIPLPPPYFVCYQWDNVSLFGIPMSVPMFEWLVEGANLQSIAVQTTEGPTPLCEYQTSLNYSNPPGSPSDPPPRLCMGVRSACQTGLERLTLQQAALESGYTVDHVRRMIDENTIPNASVDGSKSILRMHLPRKPGHGFAPVLPAAPSSRLQAARAVAGRDD